MSTKGGERPIQEFYHVNLTAQRYRIQNDENLVTYQLSQKVNANSVILTNFQIVNAFQNISKFYNTFGIYVGGQIYFVTIPQSQYSFWDIVDMAQIIQQQLTTQIPIGVWTVVLQGNNNKFIQINNSTTSFSFYYSLQQNQNQIFTYLGFGNGQQSAFSVASQTQTAQFPFNVQVTSSISIQLQNLSMNTETPGIVAMIPLSAPITQMIQYQSGTYEQNRHIIVQHGTMAVQNLVIALLDDLGNRLNISDNRLSMSLIFEKFQQTR